MAKSNQKMLREISNDDLTPKKHDSVVQNDLYERKDDDFEDDGLDYDIQTQILTEF